MRRWRKQKEKENEKAVDVDVSTYGGCDGGVDMYVRPAPHRARAQSARSGIHSKNSKKKETNNETASCVLTTLRSRTPTNPK